MVLANGARNSFSVFYVAILDEFGWGRASTAGIFSVHVIVYGTAAPFTGALVDRFGPKRVVLIGGTILALAIILCSRATTIYHFYLLFGVAGAIGASLIGYATSAPLLPYWFFRGRGMALGILSSGGGVSFFLIIPLVQYLITKFGWRASFIWMGVLIGAILLPLFALFSRHRPQDLELLLNATHPLERGKSTPDETQNVGKVDKKRVNVNWTLRKAMGTYQLWLIFLAWFCISGIVQNLVVVHQIALMRDARLSTTFATSIIALWGIMRVMGNMSGFLSDKIGREKTFALGCLFSILGLFTLLLLEKGSSSWIPYLYAVSFGVGMGINGPVLGSTLADMFQGKHFGSINGFMLLGFGLGGIVGPWFGGFVFDATKSYSIALIVAILLTCVAFTLLWIAAPRKIRELA